MTKTLCLGPHLDPGQDSGIRQPDPARDPGREAGAGCDSASGTRTEERPPAFGSGIKTRAGKRAPNLDPDPGPGAVVCTKAGAQHDTPVFTAVTPTSNFAVSLPK
jgi:hypothetical protein